MVRWDLAFTPEVSGHGKGHWGCCEGISQYRRREREYLYKKKVEWTQARVRVMGEREEIRKKRRRPSFSQEGNVQRWKGWERLRRWEYSRERGGTHTHTHKKKTLQLQTLNIVDCEYNHKIVFWCSVRYWKLNTYITIQYYILNTYISIVYSPVQI